MQRDLLSYIVCPACRGAQFDIVERVVDSRELREGYITCRSCGHPYPVTKGILDLMPNPSQTVVSEQKGWDELLGETNDTLLDTMLQLPYLDDGAWFTTHHNFDEAMQAFDVSGKAVLEIGAGRCWAVRRMKQRGAHFVLGIDILRTRYIGLETADIYFEHDNIYFERLVADMNNLPLQPAQFDVVFMTGTLHHTSDPARAMQQAAATLKRGGTAIIINEPVSNRFVSGKDDGRIEIEHGINENVYTISEYLHAFALAGLRPRLLMPASVIYALEHHPEHAAQELGSTGYRLMNTLWRFQWGQRLLHTQLLKYFYGVAKMPLVLLAMKV
jgi:SAM-dependent methyltransferase/uncharacterized protein YbaR (Trm112 family)